MPSWISVWPSLEAGWLDWHAAAGHLYGRDDALFVDEQPRTLSVPVPRRRPIKRIAYQSHTRVAHCANRISLVLLFSQRQ